MLIENGALYEPRSNGNRVNEPKSVKKTARSAVKSAKVSEAYEFAAFLGVMAFALTAYRMFSGMISSVAS